MEEGGVCTAWYDLQRVVERTPAAVHADGDDFAIVAVDYRCGKKKALMIGYLERLA